MSLTIQHRIIDLLADRLRDGLIEGSQGFILETADNKITLMDKPTISGTFLGSYPRKFEISIASRNGTGGVAHVLETTLWANLYQTHPAAVDENVNFTYGTPIEIGSSGVFISFINTVVVGDFWIIRCANASETVVNIEPNVIDYDDRQTPFVTIYAVEDSESPEIQSLMDHDLSVVIVLVVDNEEFQSGMGYELVGDIRDIINRDRALYDNTICLSTDCNVTNTGIFDASKVTGKTTFKIDCTIRYRTQRNNSRSR